MTTHSTDVTPGDVGFLVASIVGVLTGLAGIVMTTPLVSAAGLFVVIIALGYFGILQLVDA